MSITNAYMDYSKGQIVLTLDEAFTGQVGDDVQIKDVISSQVIYDLKNAMARTVIDPNFNAEKERSQVHDPKLNTTAGEV